MSEDSIATCVANSGVSSSSSSVVYQPTVSWTNAISVSGAILSGCGRKPSRASSACTPSASPSVTERWQASSFSTSCASIRLKRPKSRNATLPSACSRKLPGWGSPENWWWR